MPSDPPASFPEICRRRSPRSSSFLPILLRPRRRNRQNLRQSQFQPLETLTYSADSSARDLSVFPESPAASALPTADAIPPSSNRRAPCSNHRSHHSQASFWPTAGAPPPSTHAGPTISGFLSAVLLELKRAIPLQHHPA